MTHHLSSGQDYADYYPDIIVPDPSEINERNQTRCMTQQIETGSYSCAEERYVVFHRIQDGFDNLVFCSGFVSNVKLRFLSPEVVEECLHVHVADIEPDGLFHYDSLDR